MRTSSNVDISTNSAQAPLLWIPNKSKGLFPLPEKSLNPRGGQGTGRNLLHDYRRIPLNSAKPVICNSGQIIWQFVGSLDHLWSSWLSILSSANTFIFQKGRLLHKMIALTFNVSLWICKKSNLKFKNDLWQFSWPMLCLFPWR